MKDLIYRLRDWNRTSHERNRVDMLAAADAIEKLEAENAQLKESRDEYSEAVERLSVHREEMLKDRVALAIENAQLKAELAQLRDQKPVAYWIPKAEQFCFASPTGRPFAKAWEPLYAAPGAKP